MVADLIQANVDDHGGAVHHLVKDGEGDGVVDRHGEYLALWIPYVVGIYRWGLGVNDG